MKYKGMELKEVTTPQVCDPPREMLVWGDTFDSPLIVQVAAIAKLNTGITVMGYRHDIYSHCAEIPEEPAPRRVTNKEFSKWLAQGYGQGRDANGFAYTNWSYEFDDTILPDYTKARRWDDTDWHEPTAEYLGLVGPVI